MTRRVPRGLATWVIGSPTPIFVLDERKVVLVFNRGCEELTQWTAADVIGKTCEYASLANPDHVDCVTAAMCPSTSVLAGNFDRTETVIRRPDGTCVEQQIHFFPLTDGSTGDKFRVLGIMTPRQPVEATPKPSSHFNLARLVADLHQQYSVDRLVANTPAMRRVAAQVELARESRVAVHLTGESGVGKEHLARMIHYGSPLKTGRFVPLRCHCSSHFELSRALRRLSEETSENSLVGAVYLESVDHLPRDLQVRLMEEDFPSGLRWMSSSLSGLEALSDEQFDPQLRYRLTELTLEIPPLRLRYDDVILLAQQILEEGNRSGLPQREGFSAAVERAFLQYGWPGNVDELARVVQQAAIKCQQPIIDITDLPFQFFAGLDAQSLGPVTRSVNLEQYLREVESEQIRQALEQAQGNKTIAAEMLGIPRARLYRRMAALDIQDPDQNEPKA